MNFSVKNKIFILFSLLIIFFVTTVGWFGFESAKKSYISSALLISSTATEALSNKIMGILDAVPSDAIYNSELYALKKLIIWEELKYNQKIDYWRRVYLTTLKNYVSKKTFYYQIRVLDAKGYEKLVIKYDESIGKTIQEKKKDLQNKSFRDYFKNSIGLKKGKFYISKMNLNVEHGKVEKPVVPVVRYATPIVNENGETKGVIVLNFNANNILRIIQKQESTKENQRLYLINKDGEYLYSKSEIKRWASQLGTEFNFKNDFKNVLPKFKDKDEISFMQNDKIFSMNKIYPNGLSNRDRFWYLVSVSDADIALSSLDNFIQIFFIILVSVLFLGLYIANTYISKLMNPLARVATQLKALSLGEIKKENIEYNSNDEIGQIVKSSSVLVDAIESTIIQANAVAGGNFTKEIELLGRNDKLGLAIREMTARLKEIALLSTNLSRGNYDVNIVAKGSDDKLGLALIEMVKYLENITKVAESVSLGDLKIGYKAKGDDDRLGIAILAMIKYLNNILKQANAISKEDFSSSLRAKSKNDELGVALVSMTDILRDNSVKNRNELFFSEGVNQLSDKMFGITDTNELAKVVITDVCRYIKASSGVVYLYDKDKKELNLLASFSFVSTDNQSDTFRLGEGVVGQVGLEKEPILLKNIKDDAFKVQSGTTLSKAKEVYVFPIIYEGELFAVGEIMSFDEFSKVEQDYLTKISGMFANALYSVSQNAKIKELLEKSQQAFEELQVQSEELQESNVQMEEQQQQLNTQTAQLRENNLNLTKAKAEVLQRAEDLEEASRYKSEFLSNMSHELRTPLNSIILLSKLLGQNQEKTLSKTDIEKSVVINRAGNDLLLLINDILDLSKIESGKMELLYDRVYSGDILEEQKGLFSAMATQKGIDFIVNDNFKSEFTIDKTKLSQVLKNLLSNAFKFTKKGSVTVDLSSDKNSLIFKIIDTGIGIPADKLNTIFEAFKQVDGSISREYGGTGLGLSISKTIVELFEGQIELESELGVGTTFVVSLPLKQKSSTVLEKEDSSSQNSSVVLEEEEDISFDENELKNKNILIVDDDSRNIFTLTSVLESMGAEVYSAFNGKEAIDMLKREDKIDLVLMDIMMPMMDGLEAIKEIKSDNKLKNIPIIAVTAKIMPEDKQRCLKAGANDYLPKPIKANRLLSMLKAWIN